MPKTFYLTTPIFYPNARLHLGHAYAMVMADIIVRYKKSRELNISEHIFYRTSSSPHKEKVQKIFTELLDKGDIYVGEYQGKYCVSCEDYVSDSKAVDNDFCPAPNCHAELRKINEPAYFLKVSQYYSQLVEHYQKNPHFLLPANAKKELFSIPVPNNPKMVIYVWFEALLNYLNSEAGEKFFLANFSAENKNNSPSQVSCVAIQNKNNDYLLVYNKKYAKWQIPGGKIESNETPLEAAKREVFEETNLVVKDLEKIGEKNFYVNDICMSEIEKINLQFNDKVTEYLLEKLNANRILAHGWLVDSKGRKESKSIGNTTEPSELLKKYPTDLLRIYFIAKINFLQDGVCSEQLLRGFYHDFLVNNLSNLVSRVNKMLHLYCQGIIPKLEKTAKNEKLAVYYLKCNSVVENFQAKMDKYELSGAFSQIEQLVNETKLESRINELESKISSLESSSSNQLVLKRQERDVLSENEVRRITGLFNALQLENNRSKEKIKELKGELGQSRKDFLKQKISLKVGKLETFIQQLGVNRGKIMDNLLNAYKQLLRAEKNFNQNNIDEAENGINNIKQGLLTNGIIYRGISVDNTQKICSKCEKLAKLKLELNQIQQEQYQALQIQPSNN
ncbi:2928_t:CDS:2 [Funneliformis geosporum]|uniref:2928_t:CDS:1 n=1 Tax=Funneliformis geosporum TaxID=1117311 RepID=A0A9W4SCA4_9GLOM|nr:2928_t:CDS:2 [Funneliformis geosporum]